MFPLSYLLIAWFILLGLYLIMSLISVLQMLRFGIAGFGTYAATTSYLIIVAATILLCSLFFLTIDWSQNANLFEGLQTSPFLNP